MIAWLCDIAVFASTPHTWLERLMMTEFLDRERQIDQERIRWLQTNAVSSQWRALITTRGSAYIVITDDLAVNFLMKFPETSKWFPSRSEIEEIAQGPRQ